MSADQTDDDLKTIWSDYAAGRITDADAQAAAEAADARRRARQGKDTGEPSRPPTGFCRASRRREKMFGLGRPIPLDRNAKVRVMHWARCLSRRTEKGRAYGAVTAKALSVLEALLWAFHNAKSGLCFPSYEQIAEAAGCARSTVAEFYQGAGGRRGPVMGPPDQAGSGELPRSVRPRRLATGAAADLERLPLQRSQRGCAL